MAVYENSRSDFIGYGLFQIRNHDWCDHGRNRCHMSCSGRFLPPSVLGAVEGGGQPCWAQRAASPVTRVYTFGAQRRRAGRRLHWAKSRVGSQEAVLHCRVHRRRELGAWWPGMQRWRLTSRWAEEETWSSMRGETRQLRLNRPSITDSPPQGEQRLPLWQAEVITGRRQACSVYLIRRRCVFISRIQWEKHSTICSRGGWGVVMKIW